MKPSLMSRLRARTHLLSPFACVLVVSAVSCKSDECVNGICIGAAASIGTSVSTLAFDRLAATHQVGATVRDESNNPVPDAVIDWTSSDTDVARVDAEGIVTAVENGTADITASSGTLEAVVVVTVRQVPTQVTITPDPVLIEGVGNLASLTAAVVDGGGFPIASPDLIWTSNNPGVADVDDAGIVTGYAGGIAEISVDASFQGGPSANASVQVTVDASITSEQIDAGWACAPLTSCQDVYDYELEAGTKLSVLVMDVTGTSVPTVSIFGPGAPLSGNNLLTSMNLDQQCVGPDMNDGGTITVLVAGTYRVAIGRHAALSTGTEGTYSLHVSADQPFESLGRTADDAATEVGGTTCDDALRQFTLLVTTNDGIMAVDAFGNREPFAPLLGTPIEVFDDVIYTGYPITELDGNGAVVRQIPAPAEAQGWQDFAGYPGGFVLLNNDADFMALMDLNGAYLGTVAIPDASVNLQCLDAVWDGTRLIVAETGTSMLIALDPGAQTAEIYRDMSGAGSLCAVDHADGVTYAASTRAIYRVPDAGGYELIYTLPAGDFNIIGMAVVGNHIYTALNFAGKVLRTDITTGDTVALVEGLDRPQDVAFYPFRVVGN